MAHDVFISHASEDKEGIVRPLAELLSKLGVDVWYDEFALEVGDSLMESIDRGLSNSEYGAVIVSHNFLDKPWPKRELRGLVQKELGQGKVILPVWHEISEEEVRSYSPPLADKFALTTDADSIESIALQITKVVRPDIFENLRRRQQWERSSEEAETIQVPLEEVEMGPIRYEDLPDPWLVRIKIVNYIFCDIRDRSVQEDIDLYRREVYPEDELKTWERMAVAYLETLSHLHDRLGEDPDLPYRREVFRFLLGYTMGMTEEEEAQSSDLLTYEEVVGIGEAYLKADPDIEDL